MLILIKNKRLGVLYRLAWTDESFFTVLLLNCIPLALPPLSFSLPHPR